MRWLLTGLALLVAACGGYYYWQLHADRALKVQTVAIKRGDVRRVVSTTGTVAAPVTVDVGSQLSGDISKLNADYSSKVRAGEVLARIDPSSFEMKVREEQSGVAIAVANVALQEASEQKAQANLVKANLDLERAQKLVARGADSQSDLDTARAAQASAAADLAIAKANVTNAKATVAQHKATLDSAEVDLARTYIRSPIDGVVIERDVEVGQTVAASFSAPKLFTIAQDLSHVEIQAQVDEADIGQVSTSDPVSFTVDAYPNDVFQGKVEQVRLAPTTLDNVVTYTVIISADNPKGQLLPGMTANVSIVTGEHDNVLIVPNQALRFEPRGSALRLVSTNFLTGPTRSSKDAEIAALLLRLKTTLNLQQSELDQIRDALRAEFAQDTARSGPEMGPLPRIDPREQDRARRNNVLRGILTGDQFRRYQDAEREAISQHGTVWTYQNGKLTPRRVRLGLSDANGTEIEHGLGLGSQVVVRITGEDRSAEASE
jgi:HlyD family secretion protein